MFEWINAALDIILIILIGVGLMHVMRLIRHLTELRKSRAEMEKFVIEFNATVMRAESGIKVLRNAARESGDDLEKLVDRATMVRDELHFIVESADQLANRLTQTATASSATARNAVPTEQSSVRRDALPAASSGMPSPTVEKKADAPVTPSSRAEKELLQALQKMK